MELVFATHNENKVKEAQVLLPSWIRLYTLTDIGCHETIPETGLTLTENAAIKANYVTQTYGKPCFADDTGLLVKVLNDAPGVFSARYAGPEKDTQANLRKLLTEMRGKTDRTARFETAIVLNLKQETHYFKGDVQGTIACKPRGSKGFGYDPLFIPQGYDLTFAELPLDQKNKIGHRGKALSQLIDFLSVLGRS